jgi:hypothetical protein
MDNRPTTDHPVVPFHLIPVREGEVLDEVIPA